jgi:signal transduction histidine kinase
MNHPTPPPEISKSYELFCLDDLLDELKNYAVQELQKRGKPDVIVEFSPNSDSEKCWVRANRAYLRQIIVNLLDNAVKYTCQGCIILGFHITVCNGIHIYVDDTGKNWYKENDIDLTLSCGLAELMGGEMEVRTTDGYGTSFNVRFEFDFYNR